MLIVASGIARGRVSTTTAGESRKLPATLQLITDFQCHAMQNRFLKKSKPLNRINPESGERKKVDMQIISPRFRSQQFFLRYRDLYGDAMLEPMRIDTNMAAGNQQKHLSLSFATKA